MAGHSDSAWICAGKYNAIKRKMITDCVQKTSAANMSMLKPRQNRSKKERDSCYIPFGHNRLILQCSVVQYTGHRTSQTNFCIRSYFWLDHG